MAEISLRIQESMLRGWRRWGVSALSVQDCSLELIHSLCNKCSIAFHTSTLRQPKVGHGMTIYSLLYLCSSLICLALLTFKAEISSLELGHLTWLLKPVQQTLATHPPTRHHWRSQNWTRSWSASCRGHCSEHTPIWPFWKYLDYWGGLISRVQLVCNPLH